MELTHTSYVILGLLYERPGSGYDIKQTADHSTRHFWAISFGQIYPELKRLTEGGLVEVEESPTGSRQRNVYRITDAGREALAFWVADTTRAACEIRDEMPATRFLAPLYRSPICVGTSPLASMPNLYGYPVSDARAEATIEAARSPDIARRLTDLGIAPKATTPDELAAIIKSDKTFYPEILKPAGLLPPPST